MKSSIVEKYEEQNENITAVQVHYIMYTTLY